MFSRYTFGSYPHDGSRENITWLVLEKKGNQAKLISEYVLDANAFDHSGGNVWEDSALRAWLQDDFPNKAFTAEQQEALVEVMCECEQREGQEVIDTDYSFDNVTLLSLDEVREYFPRDDDRIAKATQYAQDEGVEIEYAADCCGWWLRSPGVKTMGLSSWNACVMANGTLKPWGVYTGNIGVRPVITINLDLASSCQYDMVEEDEYDGDPVATLERLQDLLDQLKALRGEDDEDEDYEDEDNDVSSASNEPTVLRTITDTFQVNESVSIKIPNGYVCEETLDNNGDSSIHIKSGMYTDADGDTCWRLNAAIVNQELEPDEQGKLPSGMDLVEHGISLYESANYIKLPGRAPAAFFVKKTPINLGGSTIKLYGLMLITPWTEGQDVLITQVCNISQGTEMLPESYALFLEVAKAIRVNGIPLNLGAVTVDSMLRELVPSFDDGEEGMINLRIDLDINGTAAGSITYNTDGSVTHELPEELPETDPPGYLYSHYKKVQPPSFALPNVNWIVNANGTEFDPLSIESHLADENAHEHLEIVRKYIRRDNYSLADTAREMAEVFRVDMSVFNPQHDRLAEIYAGNLQKCYTFSALRSFAWTLGEMADAAGRSIKDYSIDELLRIIDFISDKKWLNYDHTGTFKALCDQPDLHVMYVPDELCTPNRSAELRSILAQMPVISLDDFRDCLEKLHPVMTKLANHLAVDRDRTTQLTGDVSDVLYAWCSLCVAAKEPFISEDGPMMCMWSYPGDEIGYFKAHGSPFMQNLMARLEQEQAHVRAQWQEEYGEYISTCPRISIPGKKFVFTGLGVAKADQKEHPIVQKVITRGGLFRENISGVTDYLVVGDDHPGESKIKSAIAQQDAGKPIQIIRLQDLEDVLAGNVVSASVTDDMNAVDSDQAEQVNPEVYSAFHEQLDQLQHDLSDMHEAIGQYGNLQRIQQEEKERREQELQTARDNAIVDAAIDEACMYVVLSIIDELHLTKKYSSVESFFECYGEDFPAYDADSLWSLRCKVHAVRHNEAQQAAYTRSFMSLDVAKRFLWTVTSIVNISPVFDIAQRFAQAITISDTWFTISESPAVQTELEKLKESFRESLHSQFSAICGDWLSWTTAKPLLYVEYKNPPSPYDENTLSYVVDNTVVTLRLRSSQSSMLVSQVLNWYVWYWGISADEVWLAAYKDRFNRSGMPLLERYLDDKADAGNSADTLCRALKKMGIQCQQPLQHSPQSTAQNRRTTTDTDKRQHHDEQNAAPRKKEGCYIATAVYGSYDAPEVMVLRRFRDEHLQKTLLGRCFIRIYYKFSPAFAEKLRSAKRVNGIVRRLLDKCVDHLNAKSRK